MDAASTYAPLYSALILYFHAVFIHSITNQDLHKHRIRFAWHNYCCARSKLDDFPSVMSRIRLLLLSLLMRVFAIVFFLTLFLGCQWILVDFEQINHSKKGLHAKQILAFFIVCDFPRKKFSTQCF